MEWSLTNEAEHGREDEIEELVRVVAERADAAEFLARGLGRGAC